MNKVYIVGIGPGAADYLLPIARRKIEAADCLIGAKRHLDLFKNLKKEKILIKGHIEQTISYIKKHKHKKKIAVLVSGDPGLYSLSERLSLALAKNDYMIIPGISAVQLAFARIGESWQDARVISLHGRKIKNLANQLRNCPKAFLFTDNSFPPDKIARNLLKHGLENRRAIVLENLSYPNERIRESDLKRLSRARGFDLCVMIIETSSPKLPSSPAPQLYGIGIGPGDPGLVTLKAKQILEKVDIIFVPKGKEDGQSWARAIVEAVVTTEKEFVELTFPMTMDKDVLNKYWQDSAVRIAQEIDKGKHAAFVTIGDPFIYSTYNYLLKTLQRNFPKIKVETIPGISAFNAACSRLHFPLVEGSERLAIVPVARDLKGVREALLGFDSVVLMKVGAKLEKIICLLKELGLANKAVLISRIGHKDEKIVYGLNRVKDKKAGYLSVILVKKDLSK